MAAPAAAVGGERAPVARGERLAPRRVAPRSRRRRGAPGRAPVGRLRRRARSARENGWRRTTVPPSASGDASRQSRSARPSPSAAAVIGFGGSRGRCERLPGQRHDDRVERLVEPRRLRTAMPRRSASACATDGGPANTATAASSRASAAASAGARTAAGAAFEEPAERGAGDARRPPRGRTGSRGRAPVEARAVERRARRRSAARAAPSARSSAAASCQPAGAAVSSSDSARAARDAIAAAAHARGAPRHRRASTVSAGADRDDEVGLERARGLTRAACPSSSSGRGRRLSRRGRRPAAEARVRCSGRSSASSSRRPGTALEAAGDEDRLPLARDARARSSSSSTARERVPARVVGAPGAGARGGSTTIVARPPRGDERLERLARRAGSGARRRPRRATSASGSSGGGGGEQDRVVATRDEREREPEEGNAGMPRSKRHGRGDRAGPHGDRAVEPEERRPEPALRPEARREQVRHRASR